MIPLVTCARKQPARNPLIEIDAAKKYSHNQEEQETREKTNIIFNEVQQFAYVLEAWKRDFIDSTTNTFVSYIQFKRVLLLYL